jgi:putative heme transporter
MSTRASLRRLVPLVLALVVIVGTFVVVLPRFANYGDVADAVGGMSKLALLGLVATGIFNVLTYAPNWMAALPGLSYRKSLRVTLAGTAIANLAPLGGAVSMGVQYAMFRSWGFEKRESSRAMVVTGVWNNLVNLALPLCGLILLLIRGGRNAALEVSARIGAVAFVIVGGAFAQVLRSDSGAARVGRLADRFVRRWDRMRHRNRIREPLSKALVTFRTDSVDLLKRRWLALTVSTVAGVLSVFLVLAVAIRAVGIEGADVTFAEAFAAWASTRLLSTAFPVTPGGLGVVDIGLTSALTGFGGKAEPVVAAVLIYRAFTWLPPIVLGSFASIGWRKRTSNAIAS